MVCRTAYLIYTPKIEEVTEEKVSRFNPKTMKFESHYEPYLFPQYRVGFTFDFGPCCGVDYMSYNFGSREEAEAEVQKVYNNEHQWIKYDPIYLEDEEEMSNDTG